MKSWSWTLLVAFDPATAFGWAVFRRGAGETTLVASGVLRTGGHWGLRFLAAQAQVVRLLREHTRPDDVVWVAYEDVGVRALRSHDNLRVITGMISAVYAGAAQCGHGEMNVAPVNVSTNKKYATGNGRADKEAMIAAYETLWGRSPADDNEADAAHLGRLAAAMLDGTVPRSASGAWKRLIAHHSQKKPAKKPAKKTPKKKVRSKKG